MSDERIRQTLNKFGVPVAGNVWKVQGQPVIYHKALELIAAKAKVRWDKPEILIKQPDHAVILCTGYIEDRLEWSIGEAHIGVNYKVSGKQAAYPYAMAEKRAKDRVILKLIELHGDLYSDEEMDGEGENVDRPIDKSPLDTEPGLLQRLLDGIHRQTSLAALSQYMSKPGVQNAVNDLTPEERARFTPVYQQRKRELGVQNALVISPPRAPDLELQTWQDEAKARFAKCHDSASLIDAEEAMQAKLADSDGVLDPDVAQQLLDLRSERAYAIARGR